MVGGGVVSMRQSTMEILEDPNDVSAELHVPDNAVRVAIDALRVNPALRGIGVEEVLAMPDYNRQRAVDSIYRESGILPGIFTATDNVIRKEAVGRIQEALHVDYYKWDARENQAVPPQGHSDR